MAYFSENYHKKNGNSNNTVNPSSGWDPATIFSPNRCQKCEKNVMAIAKLECGHILCYDCCPLSRNFSHICAYCKPNHQNYENTFSDISFAFNLPGEGNECSGLQLSYDSQDSREHVQLPIDLSSLQINNEINDLNEQLQFYTNSSSQSLSTSPFNNSSSSSYYGAILSGTNSSPGVNVSPSPPNNCNGGVKKKVNARSIPSQSTITPKTTYVEDIESESHHSFNGSSYQNVFNNFNNNNFYSFQQYAPYTPNFSYPSNAPVNPFNRNYSSNTNLQFQSINPLEMKKLEKLLQDININSCNHDTNILFCFDCKETLCINCWQYHDDHKVNEIHSSIEELETNLKSKINIRKINDLKCKIKKATQRTMETKLRLGKNFEIAVRNVDSDFESINSELTKQLCKSLKNLEHISASKFINLDKQLLESRGAKKITPWETEHVYFSSNTNMGTCTDLIENSGNVYSSAYSKNTKTFGMALTTIVVNHMCGFTVQCYDHLGNKCRTGNEDIKAFLEDSNGTNYYVCVMDLQNGFYQGIVGTEKAGEFTLMITLRDNPIFGVPKDGYKLKCKYFMDIETILCISSKPRTIKEYYSKALRGIYCDENGYVFLTDIYSHTVSVLNYKLEEVKVFGGIGEAYGRFQGPHGITVDKTKRIIVADTDNNRVQVFSYDGDFIFSFGALGSEKSQLDKPYNVATDSECRIAVADTFNNRIQLFGKDGEFLAVTKSDFNTKPINAPIGLYFENDTTIIASNADFEGMCMSSKKSVLQFNLARLSGILYNEKSFSIINEAEIDKKSLRNPTGLTKSKDTFIFTGTSSNEQEGLLYFYNSNRKCTETLSYDGKIPYNVAISPEGYIYVIFIYESDTGPICEFSVFDGSCLES